MTGADAVLEGLVEQQLQHLHGALEGQVLLAGAGECDGDDHVEVAAELRAEGQVQRDELAQVAQNALQHRGGDGHAGQRQRLLDHVVLRLTRTPYTHHAVHEVKQGVVRVVLQLQEG